MPRGVTTLESMVRDLRLETRRSSEPNFGQDEYPTLVRLLTRIQTFLYWDFDWPFLQIRRDLTLQQGQRYYDVPSDLEFERIRRVRTNGYGESQWTEMTRGITTDHYSVYDSDNGDESSPAERWDIINVGSGDDVDQEQIEIHPMPATNGEIVRFEGIRKLGPLTQNNNVCTLDDTLIVMFAAAELLSSEDEKLAAAKTTVANKMYLRMRGGAQRKERNHFIMGEYASTADRFAAPVVLAVKHPT